MKNHARFTIRCTLAERAELEVKSGGLGISEYARTVLFKDQSQAMLDLQARVEELTETVSVLAHRQAMTGVEIREAVAKAAPLPQAQPIAAPAQDNSRLEGMVLELLLLERGSRSRTDLNAVQSEVERLKLPVHGDDPYEPMVKTVTNPTERRPQATVERQAAPVQETPSSFLAAAQERLKNIGRR